jgi:(p)ppGpp synthase/HD superfamily hydrolase
MTQFSKKILTIRQLLIGNRYFNALIAMEFAATHHVGTRRDKVTPEFDHQVSIALFALTLPDLIHREEVITAIFLHDVREDYDISDGEIRGLFTDKVFAGIVSRGVENVTKTFRGHKKDPQILFDAMSTDPVASIVKACDRIHNLQSMVGVFSIDKQKLYITEVRDLFFPMLKKARRQFPHQVMAYENCKWMLTSQIQLIEAMHQAIA